MSCRDFERYIQLYVDQEIDVHDRRMLLDHTRSCHECRRELKEMVALVSSMEDLQQEYRPQVPPFFAGFLKWVAVCTAAISMMYFLPGLFAPAANQENDTAVQPLQHSVMVLAGQNESLHIPSDETVHIVRPSHFREQSIISEAAFVYPSAVSFFLEEERSWDQYTERFVFVRVPDRETLTMLLTYAGAPVDQLTDLSDIAYPTTIVFSQGDQPHYKTVSFPDNEEDITSLFKKIFSEPEEALPEAA